MRLSPHTYRRLAYVAGAQYPQDLNPDELSEEAQILLVLQKIHAKISLLLKTLPLRTPTNYMDDYKHDDTMELSRKPQAVIRTPEFELKQQLIIGQVTSKQLQDLTSGFIVSIPDCVEFYFKFTEINDLCQINSLINGENIERYWRVLLRAPLASAYSSSSRNSSSAL